MTGVLQTSGSYASATAAGTDWRDVGRKILERLDSIRTDGDGMTVGFLYVTQELAPDVGSLLSLLKNVSRIPYWYGASGAGICGGGMSVAGVPAAVAMIGALPPEAVRGFQVSEGALAVMPEEARTWLSERQTAAALTHGMLCAPAVAKLQTLRERDGIFTVGGFSPDGVHIADAGVVADNLISGLLIDTSVPIMTATAQGYICAGGPMRITSCQGRTVHTIDDKPALSMLKDAVNRIPQSEYTGHAGHGHVHAAFPVAGSDTGALLVRNIIDAHEDSETLTVAHNIARGDSIQFVYRDAITARRDLTGVLKNLYARATAERGAMNMRPKALLYFGCGARLPDTDPAGIGDPAADEAALIKDIFGDIPMAGFYTAAEVCNGHVYGYTGVVVLFL